MSNTIPDEKVIKTLVIEAVSISEFKVTATFVGYLAARLLDLSREIKAARIIQVRIISYLCLPSKVSPVQLAWRKVAAKRREERLKVKYRTFTRLANAPTTM